MKDSLRESLSALMDDEADDLELRRLLKQMPDADGELEATWRRYHLISASLHRESHQRPAVDLTRGIQEALAHEAIPQRAQPRRSLLGSFWRMAGQGAIAASVAVVVLFTAHTVQEDRPDFSTTLANTDISQPLPSFLPENLSQGVLSDDFPQVAVLREGAEGLDQAARDRLRQVIYRQMQESQGVAPEIPVNHMERMTPGQR